MQDSAQLIEQFYTRFQQKDWKGMQACYHDKVSFSDPVFRNLKGGQAKAMWHMLAAASKDLRIVFKNVKTDGASGSADWDAFYSFSRTGRKVHNVIHAKFEFSEGKIIRHTDSFDLWRWSGMALGISGKLLGWSPIIQSKIRATADGNLKKFMKEHPEYTT
jgi:ketosteroid isomerase-like protein